MLPDRSNKSIYSHYFITGFFVKHERHQNRTNSHSSWILNQLLIHQNVAPGLLCWFFRLFLAVSSLMLLTQRITSLSLDLQEKRVISTLSSSACATLLPLMAYLCSFTTLLGGPLCSYSYFVSQVEKMELEPPPNPLGIVLLKLTQVLALQCFRHFFLVLLKYNPFNPSDCTFIHSILWVWGLGVAMRIQYYSHWKISECLNNSAGFGFDDGPTGEPSEFSDGDFRTVESSTCVSEFARRWNATTASWLRRLVYTRCKRFPLYMTFAFSLWWHGLHLGHFVGFLTWAVAVHADHHIHRLLSTNSCTTRRRVHACLGWINTQMVISCVVVAVEFRTLPVVRVLFSTSIGLAPLCNIVLLIILLTLSKVNWWTDNPIQLTSV